ncbi:aminotransferase class I/II-fold pyridoxal phosphate-dependent enzyme [Alloalcanivorax marinus]|uniref:aminotransferase class I/II-fold pyridoxal phosphate-dependent enzyme n=1 Tax=Alloalcanivorax marinus TaxID=1177169 RepID=UPI00195D951A|nr:PLP-dependent aminotransferase family protein [Alloalcanivorax marinus]
MIDDRFLYERISRRLLEQIGAGTFAVGQKLPSVRRMSALFKVSVNTVMQSYRHLEAEGYLDIRPQSGVYVRSSDVHDIPEPDGSRYPLLPVEVSLSEQVLQYMELHADPAMVRLGIALPGPEVLPVDRVMATIRDVTRHHALEAWDYMHPNGSALFTHHLARRSLSYEVPVTAEDIIVTSGAMEALSLALRSVSRPGDTVAVESPTYYGALLLLETHQRKVVEVPTHARHGISLSALEQVFRRGGVAACLVSPNAQNPLGFTMSLERKAALVALSERYQVPLIENDVWGDTVYGEEAAPPAKAFDRAGLVLYCSSFSKSLMPGLRIGWAAAGRFQKRFRELKQLSTITSTSISQIAMGRLLESGFYAQHLRELRERLHDQVNAMAKEVRRCFPPGTRLTRPTGGCVLWVRLPGGVDTVALFQRAAARGVHVFPGGVFSLDGKHADYLRLNAGSPLTPPVRRALRWLGETAAELAAAGPRREA